MPVQIPLSELGQVSQEDFAKAVRIHAENLKVYKAHSDAIAGGSEEHEPYPPPSALVIVDKCIRWPELEIDYEIVDDTPPPPTDEERLARLRIECRSRLLQLESAAINAVLPPGKARAYSIREADIRKDPGLPSSEEGAFLAEQEERARKIDAIHRAGAAQEATIEDLNEEELKTWQPASFPA